MAVIKSVGVLANQSKFDFKQYETLEERAMWFAYYHHNSTLHTYGDETYFDGHLKKVKAVADKFIHYIPKSNIDNVLAAVWLHDVIEDCRVTYNDIKEMFDEEVAELVYAVTNEKGRSRRDRANDKYYRGIKNVRYAVFIKLCDRIANIEAGIESGGKMLEMYRKEQFSFDGALNDYMNYQNMWEYMENLLGLKNKQ